MIHYSASRDIWSHGSGTQLSDLVGSSLSTLLLLPKTEKPIYLSSPWISDFPLLRNQFKQFSSLFPHLDAGENRHGVQRSVQWFCRGDPTADLPGYFNAVRARGAP